MSLRDVTGILHARLALRQGKSAPRPRFAVIAAPFSESAMISKTQDGRFAALGCDERGIFWLKLWDGRRWQPEGKRWEKIGTLDDVLTPRNSRRAAIEEARPGAARRIQ